MVLQSHWALEFLRSVALSIAETESGKVDATLGAAISGLAESVQEWQSEGVHEE